MIMVNDYNKNKYLPKTPETSTEARHTVKTSRTNIQLSFVFCQQDVPVSSEWEEKNEKEKRKGGKKVYLRKKKCGEKCHASRL